MEIKDLILPEAFIDKKDAISRLNKKYAEDYISSELDISNGWLEIKAPYYLAQLREIENRIISYNFDFWLQVYQLNKDNLIELGMGFHFKKNPKLVSIYNNWKRTNVTQIWFHFNELELLNKQYRLLQEMYYSRVQK